MVQQSSSTGAVCARQSILILDRTAFRPAIAHFTFKFLSRIVTRDETFPDNYSDGRVIVSGDGVTS
jgi:hypothetical protein